MQVRTVLDILRLNEFLSSSDRLAYDIETTGLDVRNDSIIGFSVGNANTAFYVVHKEFSNGALVDVVSKEQCIKILQKLHNKKLITFNGSFDLQFTNNYFGVDLCLSLWSEVQLARHTSNENNNPYDGLKDIAVRLFGRDAAGAQQDLLESIKANGGTENEFYKANTEIMAKYACQDAMLTYRVNHYYLSDIIAQGLESFYLNEEVMPLFREVTIPMEAKGVRLNMPVLKQAQLDIEAEIAALESNIRQLIVPYMGSFEKWFLNKNHEVRKSGEFAQLVAKKLEVTLPLTKSGNFSFAAKAMDGLPDCLFKDWMLGNAYLDESLVTEVQRELQGREPVFNLQSKHHWKKIFFEELKETPLSFTPTGMPQADDDFLESIKTKYDFVPLLMDFNKLNKLKSTYIDRFLEKAVGDRFYPRFQQNTTTSGRYSGDLQQLPRKKDETQLSAKVLEYTNLIREFICAEPDGVLIGADYASLEVVVFADDAGDEPLLNMIRNNYDFYSQTAIDVWDLHEYSPDKKAPNFLKNHQPEKRQAAKEFSLGIRYGMQAYKLSKVLDIPESEAKQILTKYFRSYPKLELRMEELVKSAKTAGFVRSKAGRIRHLSRLKSLHEEYGTLLDNGLKLWEKYHENPSKYATMKKLKSEYGNLINNSLNFPIQSMAASIVNRASVAVSRELRRQGLSAYICMNIHDELVISCPVASEQEVVKEILRDKMENTTKLDAPLTASPVVGFTYGDIK